MGRITSVTVLYAERRAKNYNSRHFELGLTAQVDVDETAEAVREDLTRIAVNWVRSKFVEYEGVPLS